MFIAAILYQGGFLTLFPTRGFVSEPSMAVGRRRGTLRPPPWVSGSDPRLPGLV